MQASAEELKLFTSISEVHSQKFKPKLVDASDHDGKTANVIRGSNKVKILHQKNKVDFSDDDDDDDDDDGAQSEAESIDTSDISTDEEEEEKTKNGDAQLTGGERLGISESRPEDSASPSAEDPGTKASSAPPGETKKADGKAAVKQAVKPAEAKPAVHIPVNRKPEIQVGGWIRSFPQC